MDLSQEKHAEDDPSNCLKVQSALQDCGQRQKGDKASVTEAESSVRDDSSPPNETSEEDRTDVEDEGDDSKGDDVEVVNREFQFRTKRFHIIKTRQGKKQYKCDVCTGIYQHAFSLKRHFLRTHVNYKYLSEADVTNCNINLNLVKKLKAEDDTADLDKCPGLYRCHICTELFDTREELKSHDSSHPNGNVQKGFSCNQCEMTFPHRQNLVRHQSVHAGEKQFSCKHCGKCFPSLNNQRKHEKIHEVGSASFSCTSCGVSFAENNDLRRHCRKAHPESFHPCVSCTKFFTSPEKLMKHMQVHRTAAVTVLDPKKGKPVPRGHIVFKKKKGKRFEPHIEYKYSCSVCKRRFATYVNMCRHKKALHPSMPNEKKTRSSQLRKESLKSKPTKVKDLPEEEFYMTIAHRISENLLYYLDGKSSQLKIKRDQCAFPEEVGSKDDLHWSFYNFPAAFDITQMMQIYSNRAPSYNTLSNDGSDNSEEADFTDSLQQDARNACKQNDMPKTYPKLFVCSVCTEKFNSLQAIEDHKINNHPNVVCTHVELEGQKDVPPDLCWMPRSPIGMCCPNDILPQLKPQEKLKCTKCESIFSSRDDLHQHILECGGDPDFKRMTPKGGDWFGSLGKRSTGVVTYVRGRKRYLPQLKLPPKPKKSKRDGLPSTPPLHVNEQRKEVVLEKEVVESLQNEVCLDQEDVTLGDTGAVGNSPTIVKDKGDLCLTWGTSVEKDAAAQQVVPSVKNNLSFVVEGASPDEEKELIIEDGAFEVVDGSEEAGADGGLNAIATSSEVRASAEEIEEPVEEDSSIYTVQGSEIHSSAWKRRQLHLSENSTDALRVHDYLPVTSPGELVRNSPHEQHDKLGDETVEERKGPKSCHVDLKEEEIMAAEQVSDASAGYRYRPEGRILRSKSAACADVASFRVRKHHTCPTCKQKFVHLASLKKHLQDICPNKKVDRNKASRRSSRGKVAKERDVELTETENMVAQQEIEDSGCNRLGDLGMFPEDDIKTMEDEELVDAIDSEPVRRTPELEDSGVPLPEVKVENVEGERGRKPPKDHCCPYCLHSFAYLSNFRKHIREVCLVMKKAMESTDTKMKLAKLRSISTCTTAEIPCRDQSKEGGSSTVVNLKGNIENSVINLLRNQSKQMEFIGSPSTPKKPRAVPSSPNFMTFSCPVCHKIFLSYVKMLQHKLSHKLKTEDGVKKEQPSSSQEDSDSLRNVVGRDDDENLQTKPKSEEERFDEILQTLRNQNISEPTDAAVKKEDDIVCLAELHDLPDEDEEKSEAHSLKVEAIAEKEIRTSVDDSVDSRQEEGPVDADCAIDNYDDEEAIDDDLQATVTVKKLSRKVPDKRKKAAAKGRPRQKKVPARTKGGRIKL